MWYSSNLPRNRMCWNDTIWMTRSSRVMTLKLGADFRPDEWVREVYLVTFHFIMREGLRAMSQRHRNCCEAMGLIMTTEGI